jgi:Flp pilus assembly protein TadD
VQLLSRAATVRPDDLNTLNNLGNVLQLANRPDEAIAIYRRAVEIQPAFAEAWSNLAGLLMRDPNRLAEAVDAFRHLVALRVADPEVHHKLGIALFESGRIEESLASFEQTIALVGDHPEAHNSLGIALKELGQIDQAIATYRKILKLRPDYLRTHFNLSVALLLRGDLMEGFAEYEWRLKSTELPDESSRLAQPRWEGEDLRGKRILFYPEQGFGDTIHFVRYAPMIVQLGGTVILGCPPELGRLMRGVEGVDQVVVGDEPLPQFDLRCQMLSLPFVFKTDHQTIPAKVPYLRADPELSSRWKQRLPTADGLNVGVVWAGARAARFRERNRSMHLEMLAPLSQVPGVRLISLQKGDAASQVKSCGFPIEDWTDELRDFADTAALLDSLDVIITIDTSVAHLAGAMGKPTWVLLNFTPDWRWMLKRTDSPWYPTLRLFRQPQPGDWNTPISAVARELQELSVR